ncbi:MAG: proprotein convertase P-domain-containing protein [Anaerolineae bacterium]
MYRKATITVLLVILILAGSIPLAQSLPVVASSPLASAPCGNVAGFIFGDTTWARDCTYTVTGSVIVMEGVTLTIEPDVTVKFDSLKALTVNGALIARGTETEPITFTSNLADPAAGDWGFILFTDSSTDATFDSDGNYTGGSVLQYVTVEYAGNDLNPAVRIEDASPWVDHSTIRHNAEHGIKAENTNSHFTHNIVHDNGNNGIFAANCVVGGQPIVDNNWVFNNRGYGNDGGGIYVDTGPCGPGGGGRITNNIVENNESTGFGGGIYASSGWDGTILVEGNIVRNNIGGAGGGIFAYRAIVTHNAVYRNEANQFVWTGGYTGTEGGGGLYVAGSTVTYNIIANNQATHDSSYGAPGGGIYSDSNFEPGNVISHNYVAENYSVGYAGGIYVDTYTHDPPTSVTHNSIVFNSSEKGRLGLWVAGGNNGSVDVTYNTIVGQYSDGILDQLDDTVLCIHCATGYYGGAIFPTIQHNNLQNNDALYTLVNTNPQSEGGMLDAQFNWWGTNDTNTIVEKIYDFIDDGSLGVTNYGNFLNAPDPDAPPAPPTNLAVSANDGAFTLTWDPNLESDIAGYKVYYDIDSSYPWEGTGADQGNSGIDVGNVTSYDLTGLPLGNIYTVRAYDNGGEESWFATFSSGPPPTPTPTATATGTPTPTPTGTITETPTPTATPPAGCQTYNSSDTPLDIPDNDVDGVISTINVPDSLTVGDANLTLNITHTYDGDLRAYLVSPSGTQVTLFENVGEDGDHFTNTTFDDEASQSILDGTPPFTGSFLPESPLSAVDGEPAGGDWHLMVFDDAGQDIGTLDDWQLELCGAGRLSHDPPGLEATLDLGTSTTVQLTLRNDGDLPVTFELIELDREMTALGPFEAPKFTVKPTEQNFPTTERLSSLSPSPAPPFPAGNVIQSWSSALAAAAFGIAYDADDDTVWVSSPAPDWGGDNTFYEYTTAGAQTGRSHSYSWTPALGPADAAFNWNTGMLWIMDVDEDDCIHEIDPTSGQTGTTICPGFSITQRGLAYDPFTDTYFAGGWNDFMIHHFAADGTMLDEVNVGLDIAGLAYNPDTEHLFVMVNASPNPVYVLDAATTMR